MASASNAQIRRMEVSEALKLGKHITPRAMRRTFQDLMLAADVRDIVTRSISGHLTESMQEPYSTVALFEQREAMGRVISLAGFGGARKEGGGDRGGSGDRRAEMKRAG